MANIKRGDKPKPPVDGPIEMTPEEFSKLKAIQTVSEPMEAKKHMLQYLSDAEGHNWRCLCGHIYPRPPIEVVLNLKLDEWLNPYVEEHEREPEQ